ncbi:energy-coupled thiamine transporter ThiT [Thalassobacillus hwangdonensis]|uniref:Energy-coupled thiamine transporter ThiT n=1 Tax=Thalassobacillus hwangdonensis TaxID=546108 RepID=A0ABW3KW66_9BACI
MRNKRVLFMVEVAIFAAMATMLDLIPAVKLPQGGSISFAMIPIFLVAFRWGIKGGLLSGFLYGLFQVLTGGQIYTPLQGLIDYGFAFTVLGLAGLFAAGVRNALREKKMKKFWTYVSLGIFVGSTFRFLAHYIAGIVFFAEYAEGPVWIYSLVYNGSYMLPSAIICAIGLGFLFAKQPRILLNNDNVSTYTNTNEVRNQA